MRACQENLSISCPEKVRKGFHFVIDALGLRMQTN
jgi:hypothetical protein